jgi:hypothetical protein
MRNRRLDNQIMTCNPVLADGGNKTQYFRQEAERPFRIASSLEENRNPHTDPDQPRWRELLSAVPPGKPLGAVSAAPGGWEPGENWQNG